MDAETVRTSTPDLSPGLLAALPIRALYRIRESEERVDQRLGFCGMGQRPGAPRRAGVPCLLSDDADVLEPMEPAIAGRLGRLPGGRQQVRLGAGSLDEREQQGDPDRVEGSEHTCRPVVHLLCTFCIVAVEAANFPARRPIPDVGDFQSGEGQLFEMEAAVALLRPVPDESAGPSRSRSSGLQKAVVGGAIVEIADARDRYEYWDAPTAIVVDGPYGVSGFPGDPPTPDRLAEWYAPHAAMWAKYALPSTTLWFWGTELSWATVHPVLALNGWEYRTTHIWDKGVGHIAGNVNGNTIRRFPVVTEVCAQYTRRVELRTGDGELLPMKEWLRSEWLRSGLPLYKTNEACGVKNAATRKYFTQCHLWYFPPPEMMERVSFYANRHGRPTDHPYFSLDGTSYVSAERWAGMRAKWHHVHGITNVWAEPPVRGAERLRDAKAKIVHSNQKPLRLVDLSIRACTDPGDVVWEPFGGLCSAAVASLREDRRCFSAEIDSDIYAAAVDRLRQEAAGLAANNGDDGREAGRPRRDPA